MIRALALAGIITAAASAHADPEMEMYALRTAIQDAWTQDPVTNSWGVNESSDSFGPPHCKALVDGLASSPASLKVKFDDDTGDFKAGEHTLGEIRKSCEHIGRLALVKAVEHWAELAMEDSPKLDGNDFEVKYYKSCIDTYDKAIKAGMPATEKVPERKLEDPKTHQPTIAWKGTIEDVRRTWCDAGLAKAKAKIAAREAPYRAVLKADKLEMALVDPYFLMPGGKGTSKPADLAAASVWFRDASPDRVCPGNGKQVHTLHRYPFDGGGKLLQVTDKDFCGEIPGSAYH